MGQIFDTCRSRRPASKIDTELDMKMTKKFNEELAQKDDSDSSDIGETAETNEFDGI